MADQDPKRVPVEELRERYRDSSFFKSIVEKDGEKAGEDFLDAISENIRPEMIDQLAPYVAGIRIIENGGPGREYGILHERVEPTYRSQAGWAAATVQKNWDRHKSSGSGDDFISFLGGRYAPTGADNDPDNLNANWQPNLRSFLDKHAPKTTEDASVEPTQEPKKAENELPGVESTFSKVFDNGNGKSIPQITTSTPTPNGVLEYLLSDPQFRDNRLPSGKVAEVDTYVGSRIAHDSLLARDAQIEFDTERVYRDTMAQLYQDVMSRLGKPGAVADAKTDEFLMYASSVEGIQEIEDGLYILHTAEKYGGVENVPDEIWESLPHVNGTGMRDPKKIGLTDEEYESMDTWGKVSYNAFVASSEAGRHIAGIVGWKPERRLEASVAPVGQMAGFLGGFLVPYGAAKKALSGVPFIAKLKPWKAEMIYGAVADFAITQKGDENLSAMLVENFENPVFNNWVTELMAIKPEDSAIAAKLKAVPEGMALDRAMAGILLVAKGIKTVGTETAAYLGERGMRAFETASNYRPLSRQGRRLKRVLSDVETKQAEADKKLLSGLGVEDEGLPRAILDSLDESTGEDKLLDEVSGAFRESQGREPTDDEVEKIYEFLDDSIEARRELHDIHAGVRGDAGFAGGESGPGRLLRNLRRRKAAESAKPRRVRGASVKLFEELQEALKEYRFDSDSTVNQAGLERAYYNYVGEVLDPGERSKALIEAIPPINIPRTGRGSSGKITVRGKVEVDIADATQKELDKYIRRASGVPAAERTPRSEARLEEARAASASGNAPTEADPNRTIVPVETPGGGASSEEEIKEWTRRNKLAGRYQASDISELLGDLDEEGFLNKLEGARGSMVVRPTFGSGLPSLVADVRTTNLLNSLGLPLLSATSGFINTVLFRVEDFVGALMMMGSRTGREMMKSIIGRSEGKRALKAAKKELGLDKIPFQSEMLNALYAISGGRIRPGMDANKFFRELFYGLLNSSVPSRIEPQRVAQSETALGSALKTGYDETLKLDPSGLSRLGRAVQSIDNDFVRWTLSSLVSLFEALPKASLGAIDEVLKTSAYYGELADSVANTLRTRMPNMNDRAVAIITEGVMREVMGNIQLLGQAIDEKQLVGQIKRSIRSSLEKYGELVDDELMLKFPEIADDQYILRLSDQEASSLIREFESKLNESLEGDLGDLMKILEGDEEILEDLALTVAKAHSDALQYSRSVTITQDVPEAMEQFVKWMQSTTVGRIISPFTRATVNVATMGIDRIPIVSRIIKRNRQALDGALGPREQIRAQGKIAVGGSLMAIGYLASRGGDEEVGFEMVDRGTFRRYYLTIPTTTEGFWDGTLKGAVSRAYMNNRSLVDKQTEDYNRINGTALTGEEWLMTQLPEPDRDGGTVRLEFSRYSPYGSLINLGTAVSEIFESADMMTEEELDDPDGVVQKTLKIAGDYIADNGYLNSVEVLTRATSNADGAAEAWVYNVLGTLGRPSLFSSPGEPFAPDYTMSSYNEQSDRNLNRSLLGVMGVFVEGDFMKSRDFLGRVVTRDTRFYGTVGVNVESDRILSEMEDLNMYRRPTHPVRVPYFEGVDLRSYKITEEARDRLKEHGVTEVENAYDAFMALSGSGLISTNGSATQMLSDWFKSDRYKKLKKAIMAPGADGFDEMPEREQRAAISAGESALKAVGSYVTRVTTAGKEHSAGFIWENGNLFISESGNTLRGDVLSSRSARRMGGEELMEMLEGDK